MGNNIRARIPKQLYDDLYNRRVTVRAAAKQLGVTENYLSHAIPERANKRNPHLLRATRRLYQDQVAREVLAKKYTMQQGADMAHLSLRTMYRRVESLK